ncbi:hypothetical protein EXE40_16345 [Halorubrum sp. GN11GM_10-3_MGM]|nr:hypothetical protein EXE40_16345 [Halorubrum sp. GN11GM_10-3_MGM]
MIGMSIDDPNEAETAPIEILHVDDDPTFLELTELFIQRELDAVEITENRGESPALHSSCRT